MRALTRFLKRLTSWASARRDEDRLKAEIEEHIAMQTAEKIRAGLRPVEARRQALLKFGAVEAMREEFRDKRGLPFLETWVQDARYSLRRLRKAWAFTIATVLTLALGIGATTSIFTLVHAVILKSLAVANPAQLVRLGKEARCCYWGGFSQEKEFSLVSYELYKQFRDNTKGFAELAAFTAGGQLFGVRRAGSAEPAQSYMGEYVSGNYFAMFGINPYAGRLLRPSDDEPGAAAVAVMSHRLWQQRYGSDPSVIGSVFNLSDRPVTVVGIAPPGFFGDTLRENQTDFFLPLNVEASGGDGDLNSAATHWLELIGRMRPGATPASLEAQMRVELTQWLRSHWGDMDANERTVINEQTLFLRPGGAGITAMRDEYEHWLQILMIVSAFVLMIVCANVANLMLVRGLERRRQTSLSMALGARPIRVMSQALTECILLSLLGGAAGLGIAFAGTRLILRFVFPTVGAMGGVPIDASPSIPVLLFAFAISLATGILFGIAPAWMATRADPIEALRGAGRSTARAGSFARKTLVVLQAALSLVLLSASGLLTAALQRLEKQDFGFDSERRIVVNSDPRLAGYSGQQLAPLYRRVHESLASVPGVAGVAHCVYSPMSNNNWNENIWVDGRPAPGPRDDVLASWDRVTPRYFEVTGNPILKGRGITDVDSATSRQVAVINEAFARRFFKDENPIGKHFGRTSMGQSRQYEIVGVSKDARYLTLALDKPVGPFFFLPEEQHDLLANGTPAGGVRDVNPGSHYMRDIVIVTMPGIDVSFDQIRHAMAAADPNLPIISIRTLSDQVAGQFRQQRLIARLTSFFGLLSLLLASIGLYGVTAYNAGCRFTEIGVRMALGAGRSDVLALILRGAFSLIVVGLLLGLPLAFAAGRVLGNQLYGLDPYNGEVLIIAVVTLAVSAFFAALIPALRASSVSPLAALRAE